MGFKIEGTELKKYTEDPGVEKVIIPDGITRIAPMAMNYQCDHIKEASQEQIATAGANTFVEIFNDFKFIWDQEQETMLSALFAFIEYAINIGCTDMKEVPEEKKKTIGKFFIPLGEETATSLVNGVRQYPCQSNHYNSYVIMTYELEKAKDFGM